MKVSFIIPLYNCLSLTQAMLASLRATIPAGLSHEIILVDDGSTDGTRAWLKTLAAPCRALLNEQNLGFAGACNRGAAATQGEFLFFLNNDLVLLPRWLEPMLALLKRRSGAGLVGNVQLNAASGAVDHTGLWFNRKGKPEHSVRAPWLARLAGVRSVPALTGACCGIRRSLWRELGGFDEGFVNGGEDIDLCLRAGAAGRRNYVALRSVVRHHISASPGRKRRDEENSRRLLLRWRAAIAQLAARDFCLPCLEAAWEEPRNYRDPPLARDAFLYRGRLLPRPTTRLARAASAAFDVEFCRWAHRLDSGPPPPDDRDLVPSYFPLRPENPPVI